MRPAFTVVELLVALVVLTIGLLALAGTAGLVAAHVGDGGRLSASAHVARTILDSLGATPCEAAASGSGTRDGAAAAWTVTRDSVRALVDLTVRSPLRRGARQDSFQLVVPCVRE
jgi:prepilin-type N-terminal cleavage/methylation domain-containing protein